MGFTSEALAELQGEPGWLHDRRRTALDAFERLPLPSRTDEEWRRTDVTKLDLSARCPIIDELFNADPTGEVTIRVPEPRLDDLATVIALDVE